MLNSNKPLQDPCVEEDAALFPDGVVQVRVALTPQAGENRRGDWIVAGVLADGSEIEVVFAGRRGKATVGLRRELVMMWRNVVSQAQASKRPAPNPSSVLLPIMLEGGWRVLFKRETDGCETRKYQLMAARWTYVLEGGLVDVAGEAVRDAQDAELSVISRPAPVVEPAYC